jgi:hypothetical protein
MACENVLKHWNKGSSEVQDDHVINESEDLLKNSVKNIDT